MATSSTPSATMQLRVVTLNCWGLMLVSKKRQQRMKALQQWLRETEADIVALQEVWVSADAAALQAAATAGGLQHSFFFCGGVIGSGLLLLSRHPILEAAFHPYSARGDPAAVAQGDWVAGKGVGWAGIRLPTGAVIDCFNTHLSANYNQRWKAAKIEGSPCRLPRDSLAGVRVLQMIELAAFVRGKSQPGSGRAAVLLGDMNSAPDTLEMQLLGALLPELVDCWAQARPGEAGATANAPECTFTTAGAGSGKRHPPIRIDYCLSSAAPLAAEHCLVDTWLGFSYSDHLGLAAMLAVAGGPAARTLPSSSSAGSSRPGSAAQAQHSQHAQQQQQSQAGDGRQRRRLQQLLGHAADCLGTAVRATQRRRRLSMLCGVLLLLVLLGLLLSLVAGSLSLLRVLVTCAAAAACGFLSAVLLLVSVGRTLEMSALHQTHQHVQLLLSGMRPV